MGLVLDTGDGNDPQVAVAGVRKEGTDVNVTTSDIWHLGSDTKAMTAATTALLIQDNLFMWNSTLVDLIGNVSGEQKILPVYRNVTVEMLSSHTSGITDDFSASNSSLDLYSLTAAKGRLAASALRLSTAPVATAHQGSFMYANMNYVLLGLIMETVTSSPAEDVVRDRLWKPLGISTAGWGPNPETSTSSLNNPYPHVSNGTLGKLGLPIPVPENLPMMNRDNPPAINTAGRAHMSLTDFSKWLRIHVNETSQEAIGLSSASLAKLHEIAPNTNGYTYGGWARMAENGGGYILSHDGSNTLNYATAWIETQRNWSVAVTTNVGGAAEDGTWVVGTHEIAEGILRGDIAFAE